MQTVFAFPKVTKALLLAADCGRGSGGADLSSAHCYSVGGRALWAPESLPPSLPCTPVTGTTNSTSLLVFVLSERSGLVAPSLSNFPHPSRTRFLPGTVVARQKAAWLSCLLRSAGCFWGAGLTVSISPSSSHLLQTMKTSQQRV